MEAPNATVLIVDDNASNLLAMQALFAKDNQVLTASSGEEAIAIMRERQDIDVILMDVQMPLMDGFEAAQRIRQLPGCDEIPIIFVSAVYTEDPSIRKGYEVGGIDYFTKPFDPELLKRKVAVYATFRRRSVFLRDRELQLLAAGELARSGRMLTTLLYNLPVGALYVDAQGMIARATEPVYAILGISTQSDAFAALLEWWEVGGRALKERLRPLARALRGGETTRNKRLQFTGPDGAAKTILVAAAALHPGEPPESGVALLIQDVTEVERLDAAIEQHLSRLEALNVELAKASLTR